MMDALPIHRPDDPPTGLVLTELASATDRLLATIDAMPASAFAEPSLLPGWTRAHVLAHLALNSKALAAVLTTVGQPNPLPMYASDARRDADIERMAREPPARIADRLAVGASVLAGHLGGGPAPEEALEAVGQAGATARSAPRPPSPSTSDRQDSVAPDEAAAQQEARTVISVFAGAAASLGDGLADLSVSGSFERTPGGRVMDAAQIPLMRWREVEIHHADLGLGYGPRQWSREFAHYLLRVAAYDRDVELRARLRVTANGGSAARALAARAGDDAARIRDDAARIRDDAGPARGEVVLGEGGSVISGSAADLAWWLVGRGTGEGLTCDTGALPELGPWTRR